MGRSKQNTWSPAMSCLTYFHISIQTGEPQGLCFVRFLHMGHSIQSLLKLISPNVWCLMWFDREHKYTTHPFLHQKFSGSLMFCGWFPFQRLMPSRMCGHCHVSNLFQGWVQPNFCWTSTAKGHLYSEMVPMAFPQGVRRFGWCLSTAWAVLAQRWRKFLGNKAYRRIPGEGFLRCHIW